LRDIRTSGAIEANRGQLPFTFPQTSNGYGFAKGYVSLFDLATPTDAQCVSMYFKWTSFFSHRKPFTVAIEIARERLPGRFVSNDEARTEVGFEKVWIPWVEAWHDGAIPTSAFNGYLLFPSSINHQVTWIEAENPLCTRYFRGIWKDRSPQRPN
jgi:hypothetical protein